MILEVIVFDIESARKAQEGGADRIELCENSADGGTTPSFGTISTATESLDIDIFVMIRPRGGDFLYSDHEFLVMKHDIQQCKKLGVKGVVFGMLNPDGTIDKKRCRELIIEAKPLHVTCHRAFDMTPNAFQALEDCIDLGFERILTSGQQSQAVMGAGLIGALRETAKGRIKLIAGSGVNEDNVASIVKASGVTEIHFPGHRFRDSDMKYRNQQIAAMGLADDTAFKVRTVDPDRVRRIRALAESVEDYNGKS